jgi:hypothetical protein
MISDETKWRIERIVNTCKGVCEIGKLLHELWRAYKDLEDYIKTHEAEVWDRLQTELVRSQEEETDET